jgi:hypothetical protein
MPLSAARISSSCSFGDWSLCLLSAEANRLFCKAAFHMESGLFQFFGFIRKYFRNNLAREKLDYLPRGRHSADSDQNS